LVRGAASRMDHIDVRILEHVDNADEPMTAWQLACGLDGAARRRVRCRCHVHAQTDFAVVLPRGVLSKRYDITGEGEE